MKVNRAKRIKWLTAVLLSVSAVSHASTSFALSGTVGESNSDVGGFVSATFSGIGFSASVAFNQNITTAPLCGGAVGTTCTANFGGDTFSGNQVTYFSITDNGVTYSTGSGNSLLIGMSLSGYSGPTGVPLVGNCNTAPPPQVYCAASWPTLPVTGTIFWTIYSGPGLSNPVDSGSSFGVGSAGASFSGGPQNFTGLFSASLTPTPEPTTAVLLGAGLLVIDWKRRSQARREVKLL